MNYFSSRFDHGGHEAKDHFLQCCYWGPRYFFGFKGTVAGGKRVGDHGVVVFAVQVPEDRR